MLTPQANYSSDNFRTLKICRIFSNSQLASQFYNEIWTTLRQQPHIKIYLTSDKQVRLDGVIEFEIEIEIICENTNEKNSYRDVNEKLVNIIYPAINKAYESYLNTNSVEIKKQRIFPSINYRKNSNSRNNSPRNVSNRRSNIMGVETRQIGLQLIPIALFIGAVILVMIGTATGLFQQSSPENRDNGTTNNQKSSPQPSNLDRSSSPEINGTNNQKSSPQPSNLDRSNSSNNTTKSVKSK